MFQTIKLLAQVSIFLFMSNLFSMEINELAPLLNKDSGNSRSDYVIDIDDLKFNKFPVALETPDENKSAKKLNLLSVLPGPLLENMMKEFDGTEDLFLYYFLPLTGFLTEEQAQKIAENIYFNITKLSKTAAGWRHILQKVRKTLLLSARNKLDENGQKRLREARKLIFNAFDKQEQEFKVLKTIRDFDALKLFNGDLDLIYDSQINFISVGLDDFSEADLKNLSNLELKKLFIKTKLASLISLLALDQKFSEGVFENCLRSGLFFRRLISFVCFSISLAMLTFIVTTLDISNFLESFLCALISACSLTCAGMGGYKIFINCNDNSLILIIKKCFDNEKKIKKEFLRRKRELLENKFEDVDYEKI